MSRSVRMLRQSATHDVLRFQEALSSIRSNDDLWLNLSGSLIQDVKVEKVRCMDWSWSSNLSWRVQICKALSRTKWLAGTKRLIALHN